MTRISAVTGRSGPHLALTLLGIAMGIAGAVLLYVG